jgi:hypothetical protein
LTSLQRNGPRDAANPRPPAARHKHRHRPRRLPEGCLQDHAGR